MSVIQISITDKWRKADFMIWLDPLFERKAQLNSYSIHPSCTRKSQY